MEEKPNLRLNAKPSTNPLGRIHKIHYHVPKALTHSSAICPPKTLDYTEGRDLFQVSTYPVPIYSKPCSSNFNKNPAITLIARKNEWQDERKRLKADFKLYSNREQTGQKFVKKGTISQKTINYAAHLQNDPDNLMTSLVYDWYFNGSNLETIEEGKEIYLIQPAFGENYELDSMKLTNSSEVILGSTRSAKFKDYTAKYCYEIIKPRLYPTTFELALRKKNSLRFIKHWRNKRIKKTHYTITWQKALWAGSFIGLDGFSFLDSDNVLTNIQTSTMQPLWSKSIGEDISQAFPATLGAWDKNILTHTNPSSLNFLDFRIDPITPNEIINNSSFLLNCEQITCQLKSLKDNLIYLGTFHNLFGVDPRMGNRPVVQITHQLQKTPTIAKSVQFGEDEVICLSSNTPGDLKIFSNSLDNSHQISRLGFKPKSILETFNECKMRGKFLFARTMEEHVQFNVSGALPVVLDKKLNLLTQNCVGDIFRSVLTPDEDENKVKWVCPSTFTPSILESFEDWNAHLEENEVKREPDPLKVNNIVRMRGIKRILGSNGLRALDPDEEAFDDVTFETKDLLNHDPAWKLDVPKYYNYKDVLAADLLSIWDFEPPEDMNDITLNSTTIQSQSQREQVPKAITKVNNWFMQMNSTAVHESEPFEVKMDQTITTNTPEIPEVPKEEPTTSKPKIPKTNRPKFLKGF